jgi:BioD-like phosphotransacetylase family protein
MPPIFIGSTGDHAGLTLVVWAITRRLLEKNRKPGFFKPFGTVDFPVNNTGSDPDALLFKEILNIKDPLEMICPYVTSEGEKTEENPTQVLEKIKYLVSSLSKDKDILLIVGSKEMFFDPSLNSLRDISIIAEFNTDLILVHRFQKISTSLYSILSVHSLLKDRLKGVLINRVPPEQLIDVKNKIIPILNQKDISNIAVLPEDPFISTRSLGEIREILDGKIICGEEYLDRSVTAMTVGASCLDGELSIFKRIYNKIILLEPSTRSPKIAGILLTGNRELPDKVLEIAQKSNIPLIKVKEDIFASRELLEQNMSRLSTRDEKKITHFTEIMDHDDFLNRLINCFLTITD